MDAQDIATEGKQPRKLGGYEGLVWVADDFDDYWDEEIELIAEGGLDFGLDLPRRIPVFGFDAGLDGYDIPDDFNEMSEDEFEMWKEAGIFEDGLTYDDIRRENQERSR